MKPLHVELKLVASDRGVKMVAQAYQVGPSGLEHFYLGNEKGSLISEVETRDPFEILRLAYAELGRLRAGPSPE